MLSQVQAAEMGFLQRVQGVTQGRTEVRWRPGKKQVWAPCSNLRFFESECTAFKENLRHCWDFSAPPVIRRPGHCGTLHYAHGVALCDKVRRCEIRRALNVKPLLRIE